MRTESIVITSFALIFVACSATEPAASLNASEADSKTELALSEPNFQGNPQLVEAYSGDVIASYIVIAVDRDVVQRALPSEAELLDAPLTKAGQHPVLVFHNEFLRLAGSGYPPFSYDEWGTFVPAVRLKSSVECKMADGSSPKLGAMAFMPKLLLNLQLPVDIGVNYYGFNKSLGKIERSHTEWKVFDNPNPPEGAVPFFQAKFGSEVPLTSEGQANAASLFASIPGASVGEMRSGTLVWSGLEFTAGGSLVALEGTSVLSNASGFGPRSFEVASLNDDILGAYRFRGTIRGTMPAACGPTPRSPR